MHRHCPLSPLLSALSRGQVAGVHSQALPDLPDGTFDLDQLELTIREAHGSRYHPRPELICLENTHSSAGGRALPLAYLQQVGASGWQQPCLGAGSRPDLAGCQRRDARACLRSSEHGSYWHRLLHGARCFRGSLQAQLLLCIPQVRGLADRYGLRVHMDGARLMNAAVAQDVEPARITRHCDSVSLCFSKVCSHGEGVPGARWIQHKLGPYPCPGASG